MACVRYTSAERQKHVAERIYSTSGFVELHEVYECCESWNVNLHGLAREKHKSWLNFPLKMSTLEERLIDAGIIKSVHYPHQYSSSRSSQSSRASQPSRPPPFNTTQKLLEQGLLVEEQITPPRTNRISRHFRKLSSASTLVPDNMERPPSSSSHKWYNSRRYVQLRQIF